MRAILIDGQVHIDLLVRAALLSGLYLTLGAAVYLYCVHVARRNGLLLQAGE